MFENEIRKYDEVAEAYKQTIIVPMGMEQFRERNEVLFSCHSCGIEGNSFTVDNTRELFEQGLGYYPVGKTLLECQEMGDHFAAYEWMHSHLDHPFDVTLLKEINPFIRCLTKFLMRRPVSLPPWTWRQVTPCLVITNFSLLKCQSSWSQRQRQWRRRKPIP